MNYTKGEWKVAIAKYKGKWSQIHIYREECQEPIIGMGSGTVICTMTNCDVLGDDTESLANANLIAASPDMYEALKRLLKKMPDCGGCIKTEATILEAQDALAKAEGKEV